MTTCVGKHQKFLFSFYIIPAFFTSGWKKKWNIVYLVQCLHDFDGVGVIVTFSIVVIPRLSSFVFLEDFIVNTLYQIG